MCLLLFSVNPDAGPDDIYLVLVNVRDETYTRPTRQACFWDDHPNIIGGMDLEPGKQGGTWLAMSKTGKIGVLLNILQPDKEILPNKKGRGFLVTDYVIGEKNYLNYLEDLQQDAINYNKFLMFTMDYNISKEPKIACFTNSSSVPPRVLQPGIHAFGNSITPDMPWPKVHVAKKKFSELVENYKSVSDKEILVEKLFSILQDPQCYGADENMLKQGKGKSSYYLEKLSAILVCIPESNYGSSCHTIITIDGSGNVDYYERSRIEKTTPESNNDWSPQHINFKLKIE